MSRTGGIRWWTLGLLVTASVGASPDAIGADDFYKNKTVSVLIGSREGGSYDAYARLMSRHLGRHLPGEPTLIPRNMPGAAGTRVANHLFNVAPKDGSVIGATLNTIPITRFMRPKKARYDPGEFNWIGTANSPANVLAVWHTLGVKNFEDAKKREVLIGATTSGTTMEMYPLMANRLFGTRFKVVLGYRGGKGVNLAVERGEVHGRGSNSWLSYKFQNPDWVENKKIVPLFQMTLERSPDLPHVPALIEFAQTPEQRQIVSLLATTEMIGRSMMAPPGVPAARVRVLREGYAAAIRDTKLLADAERAKLAIAPISGQALQKMVENVAATPDAIVEKFKAAVRPMK